VWHVAGGGEGCTRFDLVGEAVRLCGFDVEVVPVATDDFPALAPRPVYSVLDLEATERLLGRAMPAWKDSLAQYVREEWTASTVPSP
jgi:dTDP-4-dehydrorhamnose reductase